MMKKSTRTARSLVIILELSKPQAITLAAMIAEGYARGTACLPTPLTTQDLEAWNEHAPTILEIGALLIKDANALP